MERKMRDFRHAFPLIHDFNCDLFAGALGNSLYDGTDLLGDPTLAANHLAHIARGDMELQYLAFFIGSLNNGNCFGSL